MWYNMPMEKFYKRSGGIGKSPEAFYYQIIINYNKRGVLMAEKISKLIEEAQTETNLKIHSWSICRLCLYTSIHWDFRD